MTNDCCLSCTATTTEQCCNKNCLDHCNSQYENDGACINNVVAPTKLNIVLNSYTNIVTGNAPQQNNNTNNIDDNNVDDNNSIDNNIDDNSIDSSIDDSSIDNTTILSENISSNTIDDMDVETRIDDMDVDETYPIETVDGDDDIKYLDPDKPVTVDMQNSDRLTPITIMVCDTIGALRSRHTLKVLLDSGSTKTYIHRKCLPKNCKPVPVKEARTMRTIAGDGTCNSFVVIRDLRLPELDKNRRIGQQKALVFDHDCRYDVILGADFLSKAGIDIKYSTKTIQWHEFELPMRDPIYMDNDEFLAMSNVVEQRNEDELYGMDWCEPESYAIEILDAKYDAVAIDEVVKQCTHLDDQHQADLKEVLEKFPKLFSGKLGVYPHRKFHIDLDTNAKPKHSRPYAIPRIHLAAFKKELEHLVKLGVLSRTGSSEWGSPTFIIPKKDGRVRWVSDLRELNKVVRRKQYPLPIIQDILTRRKGYSFFSKLDISMQYYTFELDEESKDVTTIVTPFGKYRYNVLPMGLKCSPDFAQETMENIFRDLRDEGVEVYIDDIGAFSDDWRSHLDLLRQVLQKLQDNGFSVNPLKCSWAVQETDWLGYWLTPSGLKPWKKKIDAVLKMERPKTVRQLRGFIGMVNYYRDMWPHRAHILAPLTAQTGSPKKGERAAKFIWTPSMQKAFDQMKALMSQDVLCAYPNHNEPFHIYTDASDYQMGACIMQNGLPVAYYSKKLNSAQFNYSTIDKELLSIVMTLREFRSMLLGAKITIHTDHLNILTLGDSSQRRLRWISYVDEYGPTIEHIEGAKNVIADHFSRMPLVPDEPTSPAVGKKSATLDDNREIADDSDPLDNHHIWIDDIRDIIECFTCLHEDDCYLNLPSDLQADNPLDMETIKEEQEKDEILKKRVQKYSDRYTTKRIGNVDDIICHIKPGDDKSNWKIALPQSLLLPTIKWFHQVTGHPGSKRLNMQIGARYYHSELRHKIDKFHCEHCQRNKLDGKGYGLLPEREIRTMPFNECAVDLVGPWVVQVNGKPYEFFALTAIDTVTNLVELVRIDDKTSEHVARKFAQLWLARYPWPERCVHDNGGEFVGPAFSMLMQRCGIKDVNTTAKNPTANSICERMHQTVGNVLRTLLHGEPPRNISKAREFIDEALSIAMHAMRSGVHSTLGSSPGNLVFNRDMFLNIPLIADWEAITKKREHLVNENLMRENRRRRQYDYQPNQLVLKKNHNPRKLGERTSGPYTISKVHTNGTVTLQISEDLSERINIRRVIPYKS